MPIDGVPIRPGNVSQFAVLVDRYSDFEIAGRVYSAVYDKTQSFQGLFSLIGQLEGLFNELSFPQPTHQLRSFYIKKTREEPKAKPARDEVITLEENRTTVEAGEKATFVVHVQFRQNATWQGTIQWIESKKTQKFRSTLELIRLMDEALQNGEEVKFEGWNG